MSISVASFAGEQQDTCDVLLREAKAAREVSDFDLALSKADSALNISMQIGDSILITRANNEIATNFRRMGLLEPALRFHLEALRYAEQCCDTCFQARKNLVISCNGIGNVYLSAQEDSLAEHYLRRALAGETLLGSHLGQAINYANLGAIYERRGEIDTAQYYYEQSMFHNKQQDSKLGIALCHTYLGNIHRHRGEFDQAIAEYIASEEGFHDIHDAWHAVEPLLAIADLYLDYGKTAQAQPYIHRAIAISGEVNSIELLRACYTLRARYHEQRGAYELALADYHICKAYHDSLDNYAHTNQMREIAVRYFQRKNEDQLNQVKKAAQTQARQYKLIMRLTWTLILTGLIIIALVVYIRREKILIFIGQLIEKRKEQQHSPLTQADWLFLQDIRQYVTSNMSTGELTAEMVARHMNVSLPTLQRRIRLLTGDTTAHYLMSIRMEAAKEMLRTTRLPIREIGERCGFYDASYFVRVYKKHTGQTPGDARK